MTSIDLAVRTWAAAGGGKGTGVTPVIVAVEAAWAAGVPTRNALEYTRRRLAHHGGGAS